MLVCYWWVKHVNIEPGLELITAYHIRFIVNYCENIVDVVLFLYLLNSNSYDSQVKVFNQWLRHVYVRVFPRTPWPEIFFFLYIIIKIFLFVYSLRKNRNILNQNEEHPQKNFKQAHQEKKKSPKKFWSKIWKKKNFVIGKPTGKKKAQYTENRNPRILKKKKWSVQDWSMQAQQRANLGHRFSTNIIIIPNHILN